MKIVVTGTRGIPNIMGGVETHCEELFPRLADKGYDVTIIRRSSYVKDELKTYKGVKLCDIYAPKKKSFEAIIHTLKAIHKSKKLKADIVHIHAIGPAILAPYAKLMGMKVVFTHHGPDYDRKKWGFLAKMMLRFGERMGCMFADKVIVISDVIKQLIASKYSRTQGVHLIHNGTAHPYPCDYPEYFKELGIEKDKYILNICRIVPEKNLHHLIEAFSQTDTKGCKLVIAGNSDFEDDYTRKIKQMAKEKGVIMTGFIKGKKLHSLLTHTRCFVLSSSHEGLPIALLEAMSYHRPVIASDIPANLEVGLDKNCYYPCGNIKELASKLTSIIHKEPHTVQYNMEKYDWDIIASKVEEVYNSIQ